MPPRAINGVTLFETRIGQGPPAIVLHGGPGASHDYLRPGFDVLADHRTLVFYDQRGGGQSAVPREVACGWQEHVADLEALRGVWGLDQLDLVGYSWGALLALLYATQHPARVASLALISPAPITRADRQGFEQRFSARNLDPALQARRTALRTSDLRVQDPEAYQRQIFALSVAPWFADPSRARDLTPFRLVGRVQQEVWDSLGDYDLREAVGRLRVPALVLHGEDDVIPIATARATAALLGAEFVAAPQCGHVPFVEAADLFRSAVGAFLRRGPGAGEG